MQHLIPYDQHPFNPTPLLTQGNRTDVGVHEQRSTRISSPINNQPISPSVRLIRENERARSNSLIEDTGSETDPSLLTSQLNASRGSSGLSEQHVKLSVNQILASLKLDETRTQQATRWMMASKDRQALLTYGLGLKLDQTLSGRSCTDGTTYAVSVELTHRIERLLQLIILNPRLPDYNWTIKQCVLRRIPFGDAKDQIPIEYQTNFGIQEKVDYVINYHLAYLRKDIFRMLGEAKVERRSTPSLCRKLIKLVRGESLQHTQEFWVRWSFLRFMFEHQTQSDHFWNDVDAKLAQRRTKFVENTVTPADQVNFYVATYYKRDQKTYPHEKPLEHLLVDWRQLSGIQANLWNMLNDS
ncbi:hypothetical protein CROQUDRAFT_225283 [Cronartium quercuum f. sp. fusiforme G11]|uniref:Uncharacterized protein n=1 Tax=Cronartium quercuum f. sp. fusiforme G11 TaxID=708437 RepID=A0A9P6NE12_9BASI|nr:hypothetical protein CROQUDRAFT_225283 [Cronartium quercuum f. sp. fusiforme G11]